MLWGDWQGHQSNHYAITSGRGHWNRWACNQQAPAGSSWHGHHQKRLPPRKTLAGRQSPCSRHVGQSDWGSKYRLINRINRFSFNPTPIQTYSSGYPIFRFFRPPHSSTTMAILCTFPIKKDVAIWANMATHLVSLGTGLTAADTRWARISIRRFKLITATIINIRASSGEINMDLTFLVFFLF